MTRESILVPINLFAALFLVALSGACDASDDPLGEGGTGVDGGGNSDGGSDPDGSTNPDGSSNPDGGSDPDGSTHPDGSSNPDGGSDPDGSVVPGPAGTTVNLRAAGDFVILAKTGISTVPASVITGDLGLSPAAETYITEFSLTADATNEFSTSSQVTGKVYSPSNTAPTPSNLTTAIGDMETAYTDAAGRAPTITELGAGDIGGMTLTPGVYKWGTGLLIPTDISLSGSATDVWILQIAENLTVSNGTKILLAGGALPENIFWQVAGAVDLGTTVHFEGIILSQTAITLKTGATVNGRLLAQTAVTLDTSTVTQPAQ